MIDLNKIKKLKLNSKIAYFRFKKFDEDRYLITNDIWYFCFLDIKNFNSFISWNLNELSNDKYEELKTKLFIIWDNYKEKFASDYINKNFYLSQWPSRHILILTNRCNHACRYCHALASNKLAEWKDMTIETARIAIDTIFYSTSNNLIIEFQWWEPLLNFEVLKFAISYSRFKANSLKKNLNFDLVSNLSLMDDEKLDFLIKNEVGISTSLDWDEEVHRYNRVFKEWNSYERVTYWIKRIWEKYKELWLNRKIWALTTVSRKTLNKHKELIDTYVNLWLNEIFLRPLNPYWFAEKNFIDIWYSSIEFINFYNKSIDYILELNKNWIYLRDNFTTIFLQKILQRHDPNFWDERSPCWASVWQVAYNYNGKIYTCDEWRMFWEFGDDSFNIGKLWVDWRENYVTMINSDVTKSMINASITDSLPIYNDSVYKPYIWICPIYNYKSSWNIFPNFSIDNRLKISYNVLDYIFRNITNEDYLRIFKKWVWNWDFNKNCF